MINSDKDFLPVSALELQWNKTFGDVFFRSLENTDRNISPFLTLSRPNIWSISQEKNGLITMKTLQCSWEEAQSRSRLKVITKFLHCMSQVHIMMIDKLMTWLSYREVEATMELQATLLPKRYSKPKHDHFQTLNKCSLCLNLTRAKRNHQNKCLLCKKPRISSNVPLLYVATLHLFRLNVLFVSRHNTVLTVFYRLWHKKNALWGLGKYHSLAKNNRLSLDHHNKSRKISPQSWICRT